MAWAGQTWATAFKETTYGTFNGSGATLFPVLYQGNAFTPRKVPMRQVIRSADAFNKRRSVSANRYGVRGTLNTLLYPSQAPYWATALTPTGTPPVLPSYSFEFYDSVRAWKLLGGIIEKFTVTSTSDQDYVSISVDWIFQSVDETFTTFNQPAQSNYPTENPYAHIETSGNISLGGTAITKYKSMTVTASNVLTAPFDESTTINSCIWCGRDVDFSFVPQFIAKTLRDDFENQTALTWIIAWVRSAENFTWTLEASSYFASVADDLPLNGIGYQTIGNEVFFDKSAATDATITGA